MRSRSIFGRLHSWFLKSSCYDSKFLKSLLASAPSLGSKFIISLKNLIKSTFKVKIRRVSSGLSCPPHLMSMSPSPHVHVLSPSPHVHGHVHDLLCVVLDPLWSSGHTHKAVLHSLNLTGYKKIVAEK